MTGVIQKAPVQSKGAGGILRLSFYRQLRVVPSFSPRTGGGTAGSSSPPVLGEKLGTTQMLFLFVIVYLLSHVQLCNILINNFLDKFIKRYKIPAELVDIRVLWVLTYYWGQP